jgi:transposase
LRAGLLPKSTILKKLRRRGKRIWDQVMEDRGMMGKKAERESKLFYVGFHLEERMPGEHPLRAVAAAIDFDFVREQVAHLYGVSGHESVDPTVTLKLLFLAFFEKVRSERELMRQLPLRLDWLWFCELDLDSKIPDHSVLSKARQRWGLEAFQMIFAHVLQQCVRAGLVDSKTTYVDSTQLKADAGVESRVPRILWQQLEEAMAEAQGETPEPPKKKDPSVRTPPPEEDTQADQLPPPPKGKFNAASVSTTDPDAATMKRRGRGVMLGYCDHCLVDGRSGVVVATIATPGDYDDAVMLGPLLDQQRACWGGKPEKVVGDSAYGTRENIEAMRARGIKPYLKPRPGNRGMTGWFKRMPKECEPAAISRLMRRRMHMVEGRFADAHVRHDHRRCRWRRRWRVQIQCFLVAAVQNIKKLVKHGLRRAMTARNGHPGLPAAMAGAALA